jgi:hypothetical protein
MAVEILRNPCDTVAHVATQVMGGRYKARTVPDLVTYDRRFVMSETVEPKLNQL